MIIIREIEMKNNPSNKKKRKLNKKPTRAAMTPAGRNADLPMEQTHTHIKII
jgi:hypothetical protein